MYDFVVELIGELPSEFTFVYSIITIVFGMLIVSSLFQLYYFVLDLVRRR